jgi:hypothetical protein
MSQAEVAPQSPWRTVSRLTALPLGGAVAGAVVAFVERAGEWITAGAADPVLVSLWFGASLHGLAWGFVGGIVTAVVSLYWSKAGGLKEATLAWAVFLGCGGPLLAALAGDGRRVLAAAGLGATLGALFGATLAVSARLFSRLCPPAGARR